MSSFRQWTIDVVLVSWSWKSELLFLLLVLMLLVVLLFLVLSLSFECCWSIYIIVVTDDTMVGHRCINPIGWCLVAVLLMLLLSYCYFRSDGWQLTNLDDSCGDSVFFAICKGSPSFHVEYQKMDSTWDVYLSLPVSMKRTWHVLFKILIGMVFLPW